MQPASMRGRLNWCVRATDWFFTPFVGCFRLYAHGRRMKRSGHIAVEIWQYLSSAVSQIFDVFAAAARSQIPNRRRRAYCLKCRRSTIVGDEKVGSRKGRSVANVTVGPSPQIPALFDLPLAAASMYCLSFIALDNSAQPSCNSQAETLVCPILHTAMLF